MPKFVSGYRLNKDYLLKGALFQYGLTAAGLAASATGLASPDCCLASMLLTGTLGTANILDHSAARKGAKALNNSNFFDITPFQIMQIRNASVGKGRTIFDNYYLGKGFVFDKECMAMHEELKNDPKFASLSGVDNPAGGFPYLHNIGLHKEEPIVLNMKEHTLIAGESGAGKTVLLRNIIAQFVSDGEAVCIIDPKGDRDLLNAVYLLCLAYDREDDFLFFSPAHPGKSISFNPFASLLQSNDGASRIVSTMGGGEKSKPFNDYCWNVLNTVIKGLLAGKMNVSFANIKEYCSIMGLRELSSNLMHIHQDFSFSNDEKAFLEDAISDLRRLSESDPKHFSQMSSGLNPILAALATGETGRLLNNPRPDTTWGDIIKKKRVIYFNLSSLIDEYTASALSKLIVQDLISYIGQIYAFEKKEQRIKLVCDEFYSIAYKGFGDALNKGRQAGLQAVLGLQTDKDLAVQLGTDMSDVIQGNLPNKIYMRVSVDTLAKKFADMTQEVDHTTIAKIRSINAAPNDSSLLFKSGSAERQETKRQTLVTSEMIKGLPQGQAFVYNKGMAPYKIAIPMLNVGEGVNYFNDVINNAFKFHTDGRTSHIDAFSLSKIDESIEL